ncbi:hypothetical protein V9W64_04215 [Neisseria leonii]|uniref:Uncharacterized protein n=1 Tax=Neisseria leonii TaxID=2995413 RepID=A0A9X4E2V8_9NEIS|nr:hypothetical protein [Neisseria sp. 51.81]MDD9328612.1 hypothetical protein [Neisseria sp. 51.81]
MKKTPANCPPQAPLPASADNLHSGNLTAALHRPLPAKTCRPNSCPTIRP